LVVECSWVDLSNAENPSRKRWWLCSVKRQPVNNVIRPDAGYWQPVAFLVVAFAPRRKVTCVKPLLTYPFRHPTADPAGLQHVFWLSKVTLSFRVVCALIGHYAPSMPAVA
jgi:hypothetical protein